MGFVDREFWNNPSSRRDKPVNRRMEIRSSAPLIRPHAFTNGLP